MQEHFFTLSEFCLVCQAFPALPFGISDKFIQNIVVLNQFFALNAVAECNFAPKQGHLQNTFTKAMTPMPIFGFPVPVVLAFGLLIMVLLALGRVVAGMRKAPAITN